MDNVLFGEYVSKKNIGHLLNEKPGIYHNFASKTTSSEHKYGLKPIFQKVQIFIDKLDSFWSWKIVNCYK